MNDISWDYALFLLIVVDRCRVCFHAHHRFYITVPLYHFSLYFDPPGWADYRLKFSSSQQYLVKYLIVYAMPRSLSAARGTNTSPDSHRDHAAQHSTAQIARPSSRARTRRQPGRTSGMSVLPHLGQVKSETVIGENGVETKLSNILVRWYEFLEGCFRKGRCWSPRWRYYCCCRTYESTAE